jgi:hypothetical protein
MYKNRYSNHVETFNSLSNAIAEQPFVDIHVKSLLTTFLPLSIQQFTLIRKSIQVLQYELSMIAQMNSELV